MMMRLIALGSAAFIALTGLAPRAHADVIDTFDFSNFSDWSLPNTGFGGQFIGTVQPDGSIALSSFTINAFLTGSYITSTASDLQFFFYNIDRGVSSFGFLIRGTIGTDGLTTCSGAPAVFDPNCNFDGANPASTRAVINLVGTSDIATTPDQTTVTLVSSVSTPEPPTWAMMLTGLAGLGLVGAGRAKIGRGRREAAARRLPYPG